MLYPLKGGVSIWNSLAQTILIPFLKWGWLAS